MRHLRVIALAGVLLFTLALLHAPASAAEEACDVPATFAAIDQAYARGEISEGEAYLYKLAWVKNSAHLPKAFVMDEAPSLKCATPLILEIEEKMDSFPEDIRSGILDLRSRPATTDYMDTTHFRVHYNTSGTGIIYGWPNTTYRDAVLAAVEHSYSRYHVDENWQIPPSDGVSGGGSNLIDCYVINLSGVYGYAEPEGYPSDEWPYNRTAFFVIDNDYTGFGYTDRTLPMKVTVAHEYLHVVQMGYTTANSWWMENCAVWGEEFCYDEINDYKQYISCYTSMPYKKLSLFNGCHEYACFLWPTYIYERFDDPDLIRQIQHESGTVTIWDCFDTVLDQVGYDFGSALAEWAVWNFYTYLRNDGNHYEEAGTWSYYMAFDQQFSSYPQYDKHPYSTRMPEATGTSVQRLVRDQSSPDNKLTITFDGPDCTSQVMIVCKELGANIFHEYYMNLDAGGNGVLEVVGWDGMEYGHMISTYPRECGSGTFDYAFDLVTTQSVSVDDPPLYTRTVNLDQNMPNPFALDTRISYALGSAGAVDITVFDAAGRQVRQLVRAEQASGRHAVSWDGRDDQGNQVAPGVYFYRLNSGQEQEVRKMILAP